MKKFTFTLSLLLGLATSAFAQYYHLPFPNAGANPGGLNNAAAQPSQNPLLGPGSTDWSAAQTLPFSFNFDGTNYTDIYIAPTGIVSFTASTGAAPTNNVALPSANIPDNSICLWGLDLSGANDGVEVVTYGTAPNRQVWVHWRSASWAGIGATSWAYWAIVLEETTNNIYLVDERNYANGTTNGPALTGGIQFDAASALSVASSPALPALNLASGGSDVGPADNSYYAFYQGVQPDYDAAMSNLIHPNYLKINNGGLDLEATVANYGTQTITSLEVSYTINGGTPVVANVTGLNIASGASAQITHPTTWNPTTEGDFTIEMWASDINGNPDANPGNDRTDGMVTTYSNSLPRTVLYETFTSSTCGPCVAGNANFESIIANIPAAEYASVKYQMSWPGSGDPYNAADGNDRRGYYGINSVPRLEADGGWDGNSSIFTQAVHDAALEVPAFVQLVAEYEVDSTTQEVTACATVTAIKDLGDHTLHMIVMEGTTFDNVGSNGETEFKNVVKKLVPSSNGTTITITDGMSQKQCFTYEFKGSYRLPNSAQDLINDASEHSIEEWSDLEVVMFIQDDSDLKVLNAANATYSITTGVDNVIRVADLEVFPNPAANQTTIKLEAEKASQAQIKIFDMAGKVIEVMNTSVTAGNNAITLNTEDLANGMYLIELTSDSKIYTQQLIIRK